MKNVLRPTKPIIVQMDYSRKTVKLKSAFMFFIEHLVAMLKMKRQTEVFRIIKESFSQNMLSVFTNNGFEFMSPDEMFDRDYLGAKLKWYQPSDLAKLAEQLKCQSEYAEYLEKLYFYLKGRSRVETNCVIIDSEWDAEIYKNGFENTPDLMKLLKHIGFSSSAVRCVHEALDTKTSSHELTDYPRETRKLKIGFMVLLEKLVEKMKMKRQTEVFKIIKESFSQDMLSVFINDDFEFMSPDKMFEWDYLGAKLKWYQPSDLAKLAEQLKCQSEYAEYVEKLYFYLKGRTGVETDYVIIDCEWDAEIYEKGFKNAPNLMKLMEPMVHIKKQWDAKIYESGSENAPDLIKLLEPMVHSKNDCSKKQQ